MSRPTRARIAAGFEVAFAQMDQVALGLQLARAPQIRVARPRDAGERVVADDDAVAAR